MFLTETVNPADRVLVIPGVVVVALAVVLVLGIVFILLRARKAKTAPVQEAPAPAPAAPAAPKAAPAIPTAPGSAGKLKLYDTPPKTAAMVMAIVADKLGKPLNELRFLSIREIK